MTISTTTNQQTFGGNGSTVVFTYAFIAASAADLNLIYTAANGSQMTIPSTQYLVTINPPGPNEIWGIGGTLTYPLVGAPIAAGTTLTLTRILPLTQEVSISNQGNFYPQTVELANDLLEMQIQQVSARTGQLRGTWLSGVQYNFGDIVVDGLTGNDTGNLYACAIPNVSGVWNTDLNNGDWSLALNVQGIINALPSIPNNNLFANISGSTAVPVGVTLSAFLDAALGSAQGSIAYRAGSFWTVLTPGTNGQVLTTHGASANPTWTTPATGGGTITGVTAGTGLIGGGISGTVTVGFATVANNAILANLSGITAAPIGTTLSAILDSSITNVQGSLLFRTGANWTALGPGTAGQLLQTGGTSADPSWVAGGGATAYVYFTGITTAVIQNQKNVSSVVRNAPGDYTVTFTTPYPDALYVALVTYDANPNGLDAYLISTQSTTAFRFVLNRIGAGNGDSNAINLVIFGT